MLIKAKTSLDLMTMIKMKLEKETDEMEIEKETEEEIISEDSEKNGQIDDDIDDTKNIIQLR